MTDREKEILNAINEMGLFRTPYPNDEVSRLVSKLIKDKVAELEKLKAEVQGLCHTERDTFDKVVRLDKLNNAIDTRIKKLKGENNAQPE